MEIDMVSKKKSKKVSPKKMCLGKKNVSLGFKMMCRIGRMTGDLLLLVQKSNQTKFKKLFLNFKQSKLIRFLSNCSKPCPLPL